MTFIKQYWVVLSIIMVIVMSFVFGSKIGYKKAQSEILASNNIQLSSILNGVKSVDEKLNTSFLIQEDIKNKLMVSQIQSTREVIKYAQKPEASIRCLDDEWVQQYNKANASATTGDTDTGRVSGKSGRTHNIK